MKFNSILFILAIIGISNPIVAQRYESAGGIRFDKNFGLTYQHYIDNGWTVEGILHTSLRGSDELGFTVLGEKHNKVLFRGMNFYMGPGLHYYSKSAGNRLDNVIQKNVFGVSGIVGAEVSVGKFNISADIKPELHLAGDQTHPFEWTGAGVSLRYIFKKRERKGVKDLPVWDKLKKKRKN